jgi:hypothetical protein
MVPTYAPGLPLLMAASLVVGACGPFLVVPFAAVALVWFTYRIGEAAAGRLNGLMAAALVSTSPTVLYQALWPMSDVPAGAAWTGAAWLALKDSRRHAFGAAILTAVGLAIRPNLLPLVAVPLVQVMANARGRERWLRGTLFAFPSGAVAVGIALLNAYWYGSPGNSGYGPAAEIYALSNVLPNLKLYGSWLRESESAGVLIALLPLLPLFARHRRAGPVVFCAAMAAVTFACYVSYLQFDVWWYLRFLLPAAGALAVLAATGVTIVGRAVPQPFGRIAAVILLGVALSTRLSFAGDKYVFGVLRASERRYIDVSEFIDENLPRNSALFSSQHSGSLRFYTGRLTLRYDWVDPAWADQVVPAVERAGYHPYMVIDDSERTHARLQFGIDPDAPWPWPVRARMRELGGLTIFDMASTPDSINPVALEPGSKHLCAPRHPPVR